MGVYWRLLPYLVCVCTVSVVGERIGNGRQIVFIINNIMVMVIKVINRELGNIITAHW